MDSKSYLNIQGWMVTELGLGGTDLIVYAIVYGFTQDGTSECWSSLDYFASWCGCDKRTVIRSIDRLVEKGLLKKRQRQGTTSALKAVNPRQNVTPTHDKMSGGSDKLSRGVMTKCHGGSDKLSPNNKNINKEYNKTIGAPAVDEPAAAPISGVDHRGEVDPEYINQCRQRLHDQLTRVRQKQTALAVDGNLGEHQ